MHPITRHLAAATALAFVLAALAGSALGAPPGEPAANDKTPPGQEKKAEPAPAEPAPAATAIPTAIPSASDKGKASAPGQEKKSSTATSQSTNPKTSGINSTTSGVKPSNSTKKHTSCTTGGSMPTPSCTGTNVSASATSDHSKRYGNGKTAAQIAVSRGGAGVEIRGPGNSQPHKVCGKNGNWVDVHAVKSYVGICAPSTTSSTSPTTAPSSLVSIVAGQTSQPAAAAGSTAAIAPAGGVAGVEAGGVAGAFGVLGAVAGGTLPFTGLPLWAIVVVALAAIAAGLTLRWGSREIRDAV